MRIGVDCDGVLYEWDRTARYMLRNILPDSPYTKDGPLGVESTDWNYIQNHVSKDHWNWLWRDGVKLGLFRHGHLFPGTIKYMRALADLGDVILVTHRPKAAVPDTLAWLSYQQLPLSGLHILTNEEPKSIISDLDFFIDDKPANCEDMSFKTAALTYMMDRPWNQGAYAPCWRVSNLGEFYESIRRKIK